MSTALPLRPPIGWPLLPVPDEAGRLEWPDLATSVRQTIEAILGTEPGEQLMRPRFGAGLERLLGEPNTIETRQRAHDLAEESLRRWEPRIDLDAVLVDVAPDDPSAIRLDIRYRLKRTGLAQRVGVSLVLERGDAD